MAKNLLERFRGKYIVHPQTKCWIWTGAMIPNGYGSVQDPSLNRQIGAHRASHLLFKGPIPAGFEVDHLCRVRRCVNPDHLEAVLHSENVRRGLSPGIMAAFNKRRAAEKTHCPNGHRYSQENTYIQVSSRDGEYRVCKICRTAASDRFKAKKAGSRC